MCTGDPPILYIWASIEHLDVIVGLLRKCNEDAYRYVHIIFGEEYPLINAYEIEQRQTSDDRIYCACQLITDTRHPLNCWR